MINLFLHFFAWWLFTLNMKKLTWCTTQLDAFRPIILNKSFMLSICYFCSLILLTACARDLISSLIFFFWDFSLFLHWLSTYQVLYIKCDSKFSCIYPIFSSYLYTFLRSLIFYCITSSMSLIGWFLFPFLFSLEMFLSLSKFIRYSSILLMKFSPWDLLVLYLGDSSHAIDVS